MHNRIDDSFLERLVSAMDLLISSAKEVRDLLTGNWQLAHNARGEHPELPIVARVVAAVRVVGWALALVKNVLLFLCITGLMYFFLYGLYLTAEISIRGLMEHGHYGDADEDRINMDPAHDVLYVVCLVQIALFLYKFMLAPQANSMVKEVSQAYCFQDGGHAVSSYFTEISNGCLTRPFSAKERNLVTYAVELLQSKSPLGDSFLCGTLILDRLLTRKLSDMIIEPPNLIEQEEEKQQQELDLGEEIPLIKRERKKMKEEGINKKRQQQQQTEQEIIGQQRRVIKRLIGSESSTQILQELLETLYSRRSYDRKMREAAARIVEHVASGIRLEQFPRGIQCISSLINTFEAAMTTRPPSSRSSNTNNGQEKEQDNTLSSESDSENSESESELDSDKVFYAYKHELLIILLDFLRFVTSKDKRSVTITSASKSESDNGMDGPSSSEANWGNPNQFHGYKELVLTGLGILWRLAGNEDNCSIISNTEHLVSKIMASTSYDLVHRTHHSAWSTKVSERSLGVMLRLIVTAKGDARANLRQQISNDEGAMTTMERIVTCEGCRGGELQMKAMQILAQLSMDKTANRGNLAKMLVSIFTNGDSCDASIRRAAGKTLVAFLLSSKSVATLLPKEENDRFVCDLAQILVNVGENNTCRRSATEILEYLCIHYTENEQYISTLKNAMTCVIPKVLREILSGLTGEEGSPGYARSCTDVESQVTTNKDKNNNPNSSSPRHNNQHKLHVALLSLCATACDKLHLDLDTVWLREGGDQARDQGECVTFSLVVKMVQINRYLITADSLKAMKLITRVVIESMKKLLNHNTIVERADLESLMDSLSSISETMLDLEGCMVFTAGTTTTVPAAADTLDSLVKQARQLHSEIMNQESEINAS